MEVQECKEPQYEERLEEMRTREPPRGDKDFMERLRSASLAYQELDRMKHSKLIRNFYRY